MNCEGGDHHGCTTAVKGIGLPTSCRTCVAPIHQRRVLEAAFSAARLGVWECSLPDETLTWSQSIYDLFEIPSDQPPDRDSIVACYPPETWAVLSALRAKAIADLDGFEFDAEIVTRSGKRRWIRITASVEAVDGKAVRLFGVKRDVTEEKGLFERLRYLAECDALTGLANRASFNAALAEIDADRDRHDGHTALFLIDLDGFKAINDGYGHTRGDELLQTVAQRLTTVCADARMVARIGGDEFAILIENARAPARRAEALLAAIAEPIRCDALTFSVGTSIGIAFATLEGSRQLVIDADTALYAAKAAGRNTFRIFEAETLDLVFEDRAESAAPPPRARAAAE